MKNKYTLTQLEKQELITDEKNRSEIFFKMDHVGWDKENFQLLGIENLDELEKIMTEELYFLAHHCIWVKGKQRRFIGELAIAKSQAILDFIKASMAINDLRPLLIAPMFKEVPEFVVHINDDTAMWMFCKKRF